MRASVRLQPVQPAGAAVGDQVQPGEGERLGQVGLPLVAVAARRVLTSTTTEPAKPRRPAARAARRTAGCRGRAPGARPWPSRCRRRGAGAPAGRPSRPSGRARPSWAVAVCERSSVYARCGSVVGSQSGGYAETSRPRTRSGNMFSTAKRTRCPRPSARCRRRTRGRSRAASGTAGARPPVGARAARRPPGPAPASPTARCPTPAG